MALRSGDWSTTAAAWNAVATIPAPNAGVAVNMFGNVPAVTIGAVQPGVVEISEVDFQLSIYPQVTAAVSTAGVLNVGVGLFKGIWTGGASWTTQSPLLGTDACRENWLYIDTKTMWMPTAAACTTLTAMNFRTKIRRLTIRTGECLAFAITNGVNSTSSSLGVLVFCRWRQKKTY